MFLNPDMKRHTHMDSSSNTDLAHELSQRRSTFIQNQMAIYEEVSNYVVMCRLTIKYPL